MLDFQYWKIDKQFRPNHLKEYISNNPGLSQKDINEYIETIWTGTEFPETNIETWDWLFSYYQPAHNLTDPITVYRGTSPFNKRMWSWTTDKSVALWFAKRNYGFLDLAFKGTKQTVKSPPALLLKGVIHPKGILFTSNDREESEVIISGQNHWLEMPEVIQQVNTLLHSREEHDKSMSNLKETA